MVGFGTQKKVNLTGAVSTVGSKELTSRPVNSVTDALQGVVPGMNFAVGGEGGRLNANKSFNIRGKGTIGAGSSVSPLVLIDGMEGDLNSINPADVDNISVLKDASASSIYGSRAAGGVILVTTKKGSKDGHVSVSYSDNFRFNTPLNMADMMDSYTWALYANDASINSGNGVWFSDEKLAQIKACQQDPSLPQMYKNANNQWEIFDNNPLLPTGNTDWMKEHFGNSFGQEHNLAISGGTEKIDYYFSANYLYQGGILKHGDEHRNRFNVTGKIGVQIAPWVYFSYNTRFSRVDYQSPSWIDDSVFYHNVMRSWPIAPAYDPNGFPVVDGNLGFVEELENGGERKDTQDMFAQQFVLRLTPIKGLIINAEVNYRINNNFQHKDYLTTYGHDADGNPVAKNNTNSSVYEYAYKQNYFNPNFYAEYSNSINDNNFKVMAGYQSEWARYRTVWGQKDGIMAGLPTLNTTDSNPRTGGEYQSWSTQGVFGRLNYDYAGRYLFEANIRYDGSSRFTKDKRWNWFPSFSAGWNIANEPFFEPWSYAVNTLKLRGSWGKLGNQNTDNWYPFYPTIPFSAQAGGWLVNGGKPNIAGQPALVSSLLTWEKSRTWEIGLDFGALNNRLTGSLGYFQRKTYDMVGPAQELPSILGTAVPKFNNLDMTSKGWELQITWRDRIQKVSYSASLMLSDNKVTIDKYPNPSKSLNSYYDGCALGNIWGYTTIGIAKTQEEMDAHLAKVDQSAMGSNWGAGDIMYADLDGDGKISNGSNTLEDHGDLKIIGNNQPRYNFGLNLEAQWNGFDIKAFFQGVLKRDYFTGSSVFWGAMGVGKWQMVGAKEHLDYFRPADTDSPLGPNVDSYYPKANWSGGRNNYTQTRYLQNAAYCRLKNLTLGYTIPLKLTEKIGCNKARLFVSAENVFTITNFTKLSDPEMIDAGGWDFGKMYPLNRTYSFGININF